MHEMSLLEGHKEGWHFVFTDRKTGRFIKGKKFHYFKDRVSLCEKYTSSANDFLPGGVMSNECCKVCWEKWQKNKTSQI